MGPRATLRASNPSRQVPQPGSRLAMAGRTQPCRPSRTVWQCDLRFTNRSAWLAFGGIRWRVVAPAERKQSATASPAARSG